MRLFLLSGAVQARPSSRSILVGLVLLSSVQLPAAPPADFQSEILITGLAEPTGLTFAPDGRMFITERGGRIHVVQPGSTQIEPQPLLQLTNINTDDGERGLVGIALDPNFSATGFYYVFYTANMPRRDRVSRFTASGNTTVPGSEIVIWEDNVAAASYHHGGSIAFGPDGHLYISTGDHFNAPDSQDLSSYHGKILRVRADGSIPPDNPFVDGSGPNLDAIWARGLRNPFRFTFDRVTGRMYIADVGANDRATSIEEVNLGVAGANYGWPLCEGPCVIPDTREPVFWYSHAGRDASITGGFVYRGTQFPPEYIGNYFFGDYVQNWIRRLTFDASGVPTANIAFEPETGIADGPYGEIVDLKEGPDGALYYVDIGISWEGFVTVGTVRRIRYTLANAPPIVSATGAPTSGLAPLSVTFSSAGCVDPEGQPLAYAWTFGDAATSPEANPVHVYTASGSYTARLTVSDGVSSTVSPPIIVNVGAPPTATILTPAPGTTFRAGDTITFSGIGTDPETGPLPPSAFTWTVLFLHDSHSHPHLGPISNTTSGSFTIAATGHDYSGDTRYLIVLTVTDPDGVQHSSAVVVTPQKANLTLNTNPGGLTVKVDGINRTTPFVMDELIGFQHTLEAPNQVQGQTQYTFSSWSDGGAQLHGIVVPETNQVSTATYQAAAGTALRFFGTATGDIDRVKISIDAPEVPADVGATDLTIEWWMMANPADNAAGLISPGGTSWTQGNILIDRDIFGSGDFGDYGVSIGAGRLAFGFGTANGNNTIVGSRVVADGQWHHVAVTRRRADGQLQLYVDGALDASADGPDGDGSYRNNRPTTRPNDPFLVIGTEKHDVVNPGTGYRGWVDELRISNVLRYAGAFVRPSALFAPDGNTAALYHFDEGTGTTVADSSGASGGPSNGELRIGGAPEGPQWVPSTAPLVFPANQPPVVNAGPDRTVSLPVSATLDGTVTDDGLPAPPGAFTVAWSVVNGPAAVSFANPVAVDTTVSFTTVGTYVLRLTASDGALSASDDITVDVQPANQSPTVSAGPDRTITLPAGAALDGTVTDDGLPAPPGAFTVSWTLVSGPGAVTIANPTAVDTTVTFTAAGTYVLRLTASDGVLAASDDVSVVVNPAQPVNQPPQVNAGPDRSVTLPAGAVLDGTVTDDGLPAPPGAVTVAWSVVSGPAAVSFANPAAVDTTGTFSTAGTYILRLTASDSAFAASDDVTVVVSSSPPPPVGLLAAYGFNEGTGTTAADTSGNNATATLNGATWISQGRYGSGVSFDGLNDRVVGPTITLPSAFTLMAWMFNPSGSPYETLITIGSNRDLYLSANALRFYTVSSDYGFGSAISSSVWHHVALTSDGTNLRAYLDGAPRGTVQPVALAGATGVRQFGAWIQGTASYDFFSGLLDEVRIYNRALSQTEIQSDMSAPIGGVPPDTVAPVRSNGAPTGTLASGTRQTTISLTTNENATCRYGTTPGVPYGTIGSAFTTTGAIAHNALVSGLSDGTSHSFYARCRDVAGNENGDDFTISFAIALPPPTDAVPPSVALTAPAAGSTVSGTITVTAAASDNVGVAGVTFLVDGAPLGAEDTTSPYSSSWNTRLMSAGSHTLSAVARDAAGNQAPAAPIAVTVDNNPVETIGLIRQSCAGFANCFTSLSAWEAAYGGIAFGTCPVGDLVCANRVAVAQIDGAWTAPDTATVTINGWTTGPANGIRIFTTSAARHNGVSPTGYRMARSTRMLEIREDYVRVEGLSFVLTATAANPSLVVSNVNSQSRVELTGCLFIGNSPTFADGIRVVAGTSTDKRVDIWNNVFRGFSGSTRSAILLSSGIVSLYNNTIVGSRYGIRRTAGTLTAQNNLSYGNTTDYSGSFSSLSTNNASRDQTAPAFGTYYRGVVVSFVDEAGGNYHLTGADVGARNRGLNLSSLFSVDIDGQARPAPWDIGADEFVPP